MVNRRRKHGRLTWVTPSTDTKQVCARWAPPPEESCVSDSVALDEYPESGGHAWLLKTVEGLSTHEGATAVGCFVLQNTFPAGDCHFEVMQKIVDILVASIYFSSADERPACAAAFASSTGVTAYLARTTFKTEFEAYRAQWRTLEAQQHEVDMVIDARTRVLTNAIVRWQQSAILRIFTVWRCSIKKRKATTAQMRAVLLGYRSRELMQKILSAWRVVAASEHVRRTWCHLKENLGFLEQSKTQLESMKSELTDRRSEVLSQVIAAREAVSYERACDSGVLQHCLRYEHSLRGWTELARDVASYYETLCSPTIGASDIAARDSTPASLSEAAAVILRWVNAQIKKFVHKRKPQLPHITNFSTDWRSGDAFVTLLCSLEASQAKVDDLLSEGNRVEAVLTQLRVLGVDSTAQEGDIAQGLPDVVLTILSSLWQRHGCAGVATSDVDPCESSRTRETRDLHACEEAFRVLSAEHTAFLSVLTRVDAYALHLTSARANGSAVRMHTTQEDKGTAREMQTYLAVQRRHLPELFDGAAAHPSDEDARLEALLQAMSAQFSYIRKAFTYYGSHDNKTKAVWMDFSQFSRFCTECDLIVPSFTKSAAAALFSDVNTKNAQTVGESGPHTDHLFSPAKFVQALLRLAVMRFESSTAPFSHGDNGVPATPHLAAVRFLLEEHLVPKAGMSMLRPSDFRASVWSEPVQAVLRKVRPKLTKAFKAYSSERSRAGDASPAQAEMTLGSVERLLSDAGVIGRKIPRCDVQELFDSVQSAANDDNSTMVISEFEEFVIALAAYLDPSPFEALSEKVQRVVDVHLSVVLSGKAAKRKK